MVRCNWCEWTGNENELIVIRNDNFDDHECCPVCERSDCLMDINEGSENHD